MIAKFLWNFLWKFLGLRTAVGFPRRDSYGGSYGSRKGGFGGERGDSTPTDPSPRGVVPEGGNREGKSGKGFSARSKEPFYSAASAAA
jgi:hypothetical protein